MKIIGSIILMLLLISCATQKNVIKSGNRNINTAPKEKEVIKEVKQTVSVEIKDLIFYPLGSKKSLSKYSVSNSKFRNFKEGYIGYKLLLDCKSSGSFQLTEEWYRGDERESFSSENYSVEVGNYQVEGVSQEKLRSGRYRLKFVIDGEYLGEKEFFIR